jgi:WS/DGAT/MGAT family acyltransferase
MTRSRALTAIETGLLHLGRTHAPLNVGALAILNRPLERAALERRLRVRLRGSRRLAERPGPGWLGLTGPAWEEAAHFRIDDHVFRWGLPEPGARAELCAVVAQLMAQPLALERPLWQIHLIDGLGGGRGAVLLKLHACLVGEPGGVPMLEGLLDREGEHDADVPLPPPHPQATPMSRTADALREARAAAARVLRARPAPSTPAQLRALAESVRKLASDEVPRLPWNGSIGPRREVCMLDVEAAAVERLMKRSGVHELSLAALTGGMQLYFAAHGSALPALEAMALLPFTLDPDEPGASGSRRSAIRARLPLRARDAEARLIAMRAVLDRVGSEAAWRGVSGLLRVAEWLPTPLLAALLQNTRGVRVANALTTILLGPREPRTLCERSIESMHPLLPVLDQVGLSFAVCAYAGRFHATLVADPLTFPDLGQLAQGVAQSFEEQAR